jgi:hypothetical protein
MRRPVGAGNRGAGVVVFGWSVWLGVQDWTRVQFGRHLPKSLFLQLKREVHCRVGRVDCGEGTGKEVCVIGMIEFIFPRVYFGCHKVWVWRRKRRMCRIVRGFTWGPSAPPARNNFPPPSSGRDDDDPTKSGSIRHLHSQTGIFKATVRISSVFILADNWFVRRHTNGWATAASDLGICYEGNQ